MHPDSAAKSKSLFGVTELTLLAPVRDGLIPAQDTRSYATRAGIALRTLNTLRLSSKEVDPTPLIVDVVDDIRAIHSFRLSLLAPTATQLRPMVMLSVTFEGGWEPYMRQIWRDLGPFLDLVFCNCDDYPLSSHSTFDEYTAWVRRQQVPTDFFYTAGPLTPSDLHYLRRREGERDDPALPARLAAIAQARLDPDSAALRDQALPAITAFYRLSDMYPQTVTPDGGTLLRAAVRAVGGPVMKCVTGWLTDGGLTPAEQAALAWLGRAPTHWWAPQAAAAAGAAAKAVDPQAVQGGILAPYPDVTHGCLLLVELRDAAAADAVLGLLEGPGWRVTTGGPAASLQRFLNIAFTWPGLIQAGVPEALRAQFPAEFREGMAARAGILGDWHHNHPTRWRLPRRNGPALWGGTASDDPVELSSVHLVLQLMASHPGDPTWRDPVTDPRHPLYAALRELATALQQRGAWVLAVEPMQRLPQRDGSVRGHFGFADGLSQPAAAPAPAASPPAAGGAYSDNVPPGDLLLGFAGSLDKDNDRGRPHAPALSGLLWDHGTFLVVRKLRQDVAAFDKAIADAAAAPGAPGADDIRARLMGRHADGRNLITNTTRNDFDYTGDAQGTACPFHSHVRRANPRTPPGTRGDQVHVPRLLRRGMSYGPAFDPKSPDNSAERGLMFMACNASIAEQFEVIQAWLAGGNASSRENWSGRRDPFLGLPLDDEPHQVRIEVPPPRPGQPGAVASAASVALDPARPWVRLEWGAYLFVPSLPALAELRRLARAAAGAEQPASRDDERRRDDAQAREIARLAATGAVLIRMLRMKEQALGADAARTQWKLALEDMAMRQSGASQAIWTAIREHHGGVLRTPYGVLVADRQKVMEAFAAGPPNLTATGYLGRMKPSFGEIYLGLDDGDRYRLESKAANEAIMAVTRADAYRRAYQATCDALDGWAPANGGPRRIDVKDLVDAVLATVSTAYFGLPDGRHVHAGGWHWEEMQPRCPGHYMAPSRYMFQPQPGDDAARTGQQHGQLLHGAALGFVQQHRSPNAPPLAAPIGAAVLASGASDALAASTLVGVMMGFLPTVDGNVRAALYEWIVDRRLWDLQSRLRTDAGASAPGLGLANRLIEPELRRTMQLRPVPELTWRRALTRHAIGPVEVLPGETVVIGIVSATQQDLLRDEGDLFPVFGGNRRAANPPTHACPGFEMALGVMLGLLAGLMHHVRLRPTLNPLSLEISARAPGGAAAPPAGPSPPPAKPAAA